jgi:hypothetical protein
LEVSKALFVDSIEALFTTAAAAAIVVVVAKVFTIETIVGST